MSSLFLRLLARTTVAAALASVAAACSNTVSSTGEPAGGSGGSQGSGGSSACQLEPVGKFTFHVHNAGTKMLRLALGCGATLPIDVVTPQGTQSIGPGAANGCEFTCDEIYAGNNTGECSDCGPGVSADLSPGVTADIAWDRRVYVAQQVDPACAPQDPAGSCAFGEAVAAVAAQAGVLTTCDDGSTMASGVYGECASGSTAAVSFTLDTTQSEGTIEVQ